MTSFNQIGPWITAFLILAIVIFFCAFYITRLITTRKTAISLSDSKLADETGRTKMTISNEQKKKLKDEIVHDIVADITPVLEKRLEKAF